jgi:hypothetical protein
MTYYIHGGIDLSCDAYYYNQRTSLDEEVDWDLYSLDITLPNGTDVPITLTEENFPIIGIRRVYTYTPTVAGDFTYTYTVDDPYPAVDKGTFTVEA